jgi:hypothetical protein
MAFVAAYLYGDSLKQIISAACALPLFRQKIYAHYFIFGIAPNVPAC